MFKENPFSLYCLILKWRHYSSPANRLLPVETVIHPKRFESGTAKLLLPFVLHPFKLPSPTDYMLFHKLLIYVHVWKPVARNYEEIIGFEQEMAGDTAST
jgi:hypothetical protein